MKVKARLAKEITPLLRAAVKSQIECWVFQRQIERKIGVDFRNMERAVGDLAQQVIQKQSMMRRLGHSLKALSSNVRPNLSHLERRTHVIFDNHPWHQ